MKTQGYIISGSSAHDRHANGMSIIYKLSDGTLFVYDGGNISVKDLLRKTLHDLSDGAPVISAWMITHPHGDHYGALKLLLEEGLGDIKINEFWFNWSEGAGPNLEEAIFAVHCPDVPVRKLSYGERIQLADVDIEVICTPDVLLEYAPDAYTVADGSNNATVVTMLTIGGKRVLMSGDAGPIAWNFMMENKDKHSLKCDYIQIPHHGVHNSGTDEAYAEMEATHLVIPAGLSLAKHFTLETNKNVAAQASWRLYKKLGVDMSYETETDGKTYWFAGTYDAENTEDVKLFIEA